MVWRKLAQLLKAKKDKEFTRKEQRKKRPPGKTVGYDRLGYGQIIKKPE